MGKARRSVDWSIIFGAPKAGKSAFANVPYPKVSGPYSNVVLGLENYTMECTLVNIYGQPLPDRQTVAFQQLPNSRWTNVDPIVWENLRVEGPFDAIALYSEGSNEPWIHAKMTVIHAALKGGSVRVPAGELSVDGLSLMRVGRRVPKPLVIEEDPL